jgi:hypothetical protein
MIELAILDDDGDVIAQQRCEGDRHFDFTYAGVRGTITVIDESRYCPNCEALRQRVAMLEKGMEFIYETLLPYAPEAALYSKPIYTAWLEASAALAPQEGE